MSERLILDGSKSSPTRDSSKILRKESPVTAVVSSVVKKLPQKSSNKVTQNLPLLDLTQGKSQRPLKGTTKELKNIKLKFHKRKPFSKDHAATHKLVSNSKEPVSKDDKATHKTVSDSKAHVDKKEIKSTKSSCDKKSLKESLAKSAKEKRSSKSEAIKLDKGFETGTGDTKGSKKKGGKSPRTQEKENVFEEKSEIIQPKGFSKTMLLNKQKHLKYLEANRKVQANGIAKEKTRLKESLNKNMPQKKNIIIAPPSSPDNVSDVVECDNERSVKPNLMIKEDAVGPYHIHYKDKNPQDEEPLFFKRRIKFPDHPTRNVDFDIKKKFKDNTVFYKLSDKRFIDNGWTQLPTMKVMRMMNIYKMVPVNPQNNWFERHKLDKELFYSNGDKLADIDHDGRGRLYYRNGTIALDYYNSQDSNTGQRYIVYSSGTEIECGKLTPRTILAVFDGLGNGVVYDHYGKVRLKYNQSEGVLMDPKLGAPGKWKWHDLNDPPVLKQVLINTCLKETDPLLERLTKSEDKLDEPKKTFDSKMLEIELDNLVKENTCKLTQKFKPFQIRMKAVKLNKQFSLKIMDQTNIHLHYRDKETNLKLNLGFMLISNEIIDTDTSEISEVSTPYDKYPARTNSVENIQKILKSVRSGKELPPLNLGSKYSI